MSVDTLCKKGYQVVVSRFGADHTAIHSVRHLPVTGIKFHAEYFDESMDSERDVLILKKIVEMTKELGMTVTCGGIHTQLQEDFVKSLGVECLEGDMYYGFLRTNVFEKCCL
jgi:EAL domain-containing protein (putative c-di-GMP-specific phosphodiesterase class I)